MESSAAGPSNSIESSDSGPSTSSSSGPAAFDSSKSEPEDSQEPGVMKIYTPRKYGHPGVPIFT